MKHAIFLFSLLLPLAALAAGPAAVYRWVDSNGVVHYSDQPHPGAVKVDLGAPSVVHFKKASSPAELPREATSVRAAQRHYQVAILAPSDGTTLRPANWAVHTRVSVKPELGRGAVLRYALDGKAVGSPTASWNLTLKPVYRGAHTLTVTVVGPGGQAEGQASSTFYIHHPSLLSKHPRPSGG